MKKEIVNVGGVSSGIRFSKPEMKVHELKEGDIVDLADMVVIKKKTPPQASKKQIEVSE